MHKINLGRINRFFLLKIRQEIVHRIFEFSDTLNFTLQLIPEINGIQFQNGFLKFEIRVFSSFVREKKIRGRNAELV